MRTPDTPDSPVAGTNTLKSIIQNRVLVMSAAALSLMLSSMHRPRHISPIVDTSITLASDGESADDKSPYETALRQTCPTGQQKAQLDTEIDACFDQLSMDVVATIGLFKFNHPNPTPEDMKTLLGSLPTCMRPRIIRIAKLVALHPEESERVQERVSDRIGYSFESEKRESCGNPEVDRENARRERYYRLRHIRREAMELLKECDECPSDFEEELGKIMYAEIVLDGYRQQVAKVSK